MKRIKELSWVSDYKLSVTFESGEKRLVDFSGFKKDGVFQEFENPSYFKQVTNKGYFVEWPHEQDLSADTLYEMSREIRG